MSEMRNYNSPEVSVRDFGSKKDEFKKRFDEIINEPLTVDNIDSFGDDALNNIIALVDEVVQDYGVQHSGEDEIWELDRNALESQACVEYGLPETSPILDLIVAKNHQLEAIDQFIKNNIIQRDETIVPPDNLTVNLGNGEGGEKRDLNIIPRLKTLLYILQTDFAIDLKDVALTKGQNAKEMMRQLSYVTVESPDIKRVVQVCDEEGNASYIFDLAEMEKHGISVEDLNQTTKEEKNDLIKQYAGLGVRVIQSPNWRFVVSEYLSEKIPEREKRDTSDIFKSESDQQIPEVSKSEIDPWRGFWADEDGKHWGPVTQLVKKIGLSRESLLLRANRAELSSQKIKDVGGHQVSAYCFEDISNLAEIKEFSSLPSVETGGEWEGFWTDEEGRHWGTLRSIGPKLKVDSSTIKNRINNILLAKELKGLSGKKIEAYCLEDIEQLPSIIEFRDLPSVETEGEWEGFWTDEEGRHWGPLYIISKKLDMVIKTISDRLENTELSPKIFKGLNNRKTEIWCLEDIIQLPSIIEFRDLPSAETEGEWEGFWTNEDGKHWGVAHVISKKLGLGIEVVSDRIKDAGLSSKPLKGLNGMKRDAWCIEEVVKLSSIIDFIASHQVETAGEWRGFWTDEEGRHWGAVNAISKKLNLDKTIRSEAIKKHKLTTRSIRGLLGRKMDAYCLEEVEKYLNT